MFYFVKCTQLHIHIYIQARLRKKNPFEKLFMCDQFWKQRIALKMVRKFLKNFSSKVFSYVRAYFDTKL